MGYYIKEEEFKKRVSKRRDMLGMPTLLKSKDKITILGVSSGMACSTRMECQFLSWEVVEKYAQYKNIIKLNVLPKGKRKNVYFLLQDSDLILRGWSLGFKVDSETNSFCGNALINVVAPKNIESIKELIELNYLMGSKGIVVFKNEGKETPVFMEKAEEIRYEHAVLNRIMSNC